MSALRTYSLLRKKIAVGANHWDVIALLLVFALITLLASGATQLSAPFQLGQPISISLAPSHLPSYALQTVLRMGIALIFSLLFTFTFATFAAKSRHAEKIIIPLIDILQSVPVLAFLSITIVSFIALFPGSLWGPQCASIFVIFTAQAWNMALSFYQSLKTVPNDFKEAAAMFHLSSWQRFWRIEVPFSMPGLLWNTMMSMSASWFSLVASEAVSVSNQTITIPGIGSYIATAIHQANITAVFYAIITMLLVIFLYDQLLFRPLISWSEKFTNEQTASESIPSSWVISLLRRTKILRQLTDLFDAFADVFINLRFLRGKNTYSDSVLDSRTAKYIEIVWNIFVAVAVLTSLFILIRFILTYISLPEVGHALLLGLMTGARVVVVLIFSSLVWIPLGVWIGLRPRAAEIVQPICQFLAAFPANLLFPVVVIAILKWHLNVNIWTTPLIILGAQWYIVFNVIAGASAIPKDLRQAADNFSVRGWLWWRSLILPSIFPYYITGAITAVGGAWNASLIAEVITWGDTTLRAKGIGAYIVQHNGNFPHTVLGVSIMCLFVLLLNRLVWRPLYALAETRFRFD